MPSPMLAVALNDQKYTQALMAKGFVPSQSVEYGGKSYSHDEIAAMVDSAYMRHRGEFSSNSNGLTNPRRQKRLDRRNTNKFKVAVRNDVASNFNISPWTIFFGVLVMIFSGPFGLVMAVIACVFEYYLEKDLDGDQTMMAAVGA